MSSARAAAELVCSSSFSFLEGASSPEELVEEADRLGLQAIGLTDRDGVYGLPRAWRRLKELRAAGKGAVNLVAGARLTVEEGPGLILLARDAAGGHAQPPRGRAPGRHPRDLGGRPAHPRWGREGPRRPPPLADPRHERRP